METSLGDLLWLSPIEALAIVLATAGMYAALVVFVRLLGQRVLSGMSSFDLAAVIAFGSVIGRAALGESPVLGGGLVALATLIAMQGAVGLLRGPRWGNRAVSVPPVLLMAGPNLIEEHMQRCHVLPQELQSRLRAAGIRHPSEVAAVTFEPSGGISVLRRGEAIDPLLLSGVVGASLVPAELLAQPDQT
ncbi:DUF421 domain-containing protein [Ornithinimicrobium faecis]|uniref:DUF421 domain-containing protein n=1 Tax=Ornithinimicrobium faecis TaxID=2934158 RepID=A0ABY4YS33_9MICO|nr:YetF domain-containing protein [Ornithinimicrobium sp. HY1793]USQ79100.1 DUF421 domain-containing protein [Ornithinimicrobium sp. HY1793]